MDKDLEIKHASLEVQVWGGRSRRGDREGREGRVEGRRGGGDGQAPHTCTSSSRVRERERRREGDEEAEGREGDKRDGWIGGHRVEEEGG
jgi:hypothetical protein